MSLQIWCVWTHIEYLTIDELEEKKNWKTLSRVNLYCPFYPGTMLTSFHHLYVNNGLRSHSVFSKAEKIQPLLRENLFYHFISDITYNIGHIRTLRLKYVAVRHNSEIIWHQHLWPLIYFMFSLQLNKWGFKFPLFFLNQWTWLYHCMAVEMLHLTPVAVL